MLLGLEKPITWVADKLIEYFKDKDARKREQWDRVADFFDKIATTLEDMTISFRNKTIPRVEGNELKVLISSFTEVVPSIYSPDQDNDRKKMHELLSELYQTAEKANDQDMQYLMINYLGNNIHGASEKNIEDIERVAGKYRGLATVLRAKKSK